MAHTLYVGVLVLLGVTVASAVDCDPHRPRDRDCTSQDQRQRSYTDLNTQLKNARDLEHFPEFIVNITMGMWQYLYPCQSERETALWLFYGVKDETPASGPGMVGRRRRATHYDTEEDLLRSMLDKLRHDTGREGDCILHLINVYKGTAAANWKHKHPHYYSPPHTTHKPTTTPTTPKPTTKPTTPKPTTKPTTPKPTTKPTTPKPTTEPTTPTTKPTTPTTPTTKPTTPTTPTTKPTTPKPTTKPTTPKPTPPPTTTETTQATTVTIAPDTTHAAIAPGKCTTCAMLDCLLAPKLTDCPAATPLCITTVRDNNGGRDISRGCASVAKCDAVQRSPDCADIETSTLSGGIVCDYCCQGDNCNRPPQLVPDAAALYPRP